MSKSKEKCLPPTVKIVFDNADAKESNKLLEKLDQVLIQNGWKFVSRFSHEGIVFVKYFKKGEDE